MYTARAPFEPARLAAVLSTLPVHPATPVRPPYSDAKVANRDIRVWHLVIENGY
jgi:hypothetical protein